MRCLLSGPGKGMVDQKISGKLARERRAPPREPRFGLGLSPQLWSCGTVTLTDIVDVFPVLSVQVIVMV